MRDHRKLQVFHLADALVLLVYRETKGFPREETFGLVSQMRRCAVSVAANIVEGSARRTDRDYNHFLNTSFSSIRELGYYVSLAQRLGYLNDLSAASLRDAHGRTAAALAGLIRARERQG